MEQSVGPSADRRTLSAILCAEVCDLSQVLAAGDARRETMVSNCWALAERTIPRHHGSTLAVTANGRIVAAFRSAVEATECAIAMQLFHRPSRETDPDLPGPSHQIQHPPLPAGPSAPRIHGIRAS